MDSSSAAQELFNCIPDLRLMGMAELVIVHAISVEQLQGRRLDAYRQAFTRRMEDKIKALEQTGIAAKLLLPFGNPAEEIALTAEEEDVDLIFIGSIGENIIREFLLGSTVTEVIRRSSRPILIEKYITLGERTRLIPIFLQKWSTVLLPTDFSREAESVYSKFSAVADKIHRIIFLHVIDKAQGGKELSRQEEKALHGLQDWQEKFRRNGGNKVDIKVSAGIPSQRINEIAETEGVTLIAMPTRGVGLVKLFMGRTADAVVRRSSAPVLLFKID